MLRLRAPLFFANLVVLALAVTTLLTGRPAATVPQQYLDEPLAGPGNWFDSQRAEGQARDSYARALRQAEALERATQRSRPELAEASWTLLGPTNIGGRVNDVVVDPTRNITAAGGGGVVYAAAASGGVWKSTTAGETWTYAWDDDLTQAIGALAIGSDGTLWAGTGEANPGGGSIVYGGTGMYRSTDGGATWDFVGLRSSGAIGRIMVHPTDPKRVWVASSGNLFVPGGQRGLYRTANAGKTWKRVLAGQNDTTGAVDVAIDPENPDNILAAMWDHHRTPDHRIYGGVGSGVWRSTDGGVTWTEVRDINLDPESETGRIGVAFSPADPSRAYALIANKLDGSFGAWFRSDDGGATWQRLDGEGVRTPLVNVASLAANQSTYGWWFGRIFPDPDQKDRVFVTGLEMMASEDGGRTFTVMGNVLAGVVSGAHQVNVHADQHGMAWDPSVPGRVYAANDGGVYRSDADGHTGTWHGAVSQGWTQHYSVDVHEADPDYMATGLQDNMCQRSYAGDDGAVTKTTWNKVGLCGDGVWARIHPTDASIMYLCSQYGNCGRFVGGNPVSTGFGSRPASRNGWQTPIEFDPNNPSIMYAGTNMISRSTNGGQSWTRISDDLSGDPEQTDPNKGYRLRGVITAIGVPASDGQSLWAGTDNGFLWHTADMGGEWTKIANEELPDGLWITHIEVDPSDADHVWVTYSGFRNGSDAAHIYETRDGGATWAGVSTNLPDAPVNDLVVAGDDLVAATDVGVFLSEGLVVDGEREWFELGANLPAVPVVDLRYHEGTNTVTTATFGHGIQRVTLP